MRVLHIGTEMTWRGGENQTRLLAEGLKRHGVESVIAYPRKSRAFERFAKDFTMVPLHSSSPLDLRNVWSLQQAVAEHKIDLLDAQGAKGHTLALRLKKIFPDLGLVVHRRVDNPIKRGYFTRKKYMSPLVDRYTCISTAISQIVRDYGVPPEKITVVRSAVEEAPYLQIDRDRSRRELRERLQVKPNTIVIGNASAFTDQKGYDFLVPALAKLRDTGVPFHAAFAGEGNREPNIRSQVKLLNLEDRVTFLGYIDGVREFLCGLDVLAVPSRNEGLGTILWEGAFAGPAIVASRVGGIPEIIKDRDTGLLVPVGDIEALTKALTELVVDSEIRRKLSGQALHYARRECSVEKMVEGNLAVYREVLAAKTKTNTQAATKK